MKRRYFLGAVPFALASLAIGWRSPSVVVPEVHEAFGEYMGDCLVMTDKSDKRIKFTVQKCSIFQNFEEWKRAGGWSDMERSFHAQRMALSA